MRPDFADGDLDAELVFDRFLDGDELDRVQVALVAVAPKWCSRLRVWRSSKDQVPIDVSQPDALAAAVLVAAGERGPTYRRLVEEYGTPPFERFRGSVELRGAGPEMVVVISVDQMVLSPLGSKKRLGNRLSLQVRRPKVEGQLGSAWVRSSFEVLCSALAPAWGAAKHPHEYRAKVMSDAPSVEAVGRDFGRHLPGVFWINFLGRPYRNLLGDDRLRSVPGKIADVGDGVIVMLGPEPGLWDDPSFAAAEQKVRDHLGTQLFFSKADPDRVGLVPDWG